jgi:lipoprotein-anchoring transpeptidase ErfK/SrfK
VALVSRVAGGNAGAASGVLTHGGGTQSLVSGAVNVRARSLAGAITLVIAASGLAGCQGAPRASVQPPSQGSASAGGGGASPSSTLGTTPAASPSVVTITPSSGTSVRLDQAVVVQAVHGPLTSVQAVADTGAVLTGEKDAAGSTWTSTGGLLPGATYTVTAVAADGTGTTMTQTASFTTLKPKSTASLYLIPDDGWTVGVGMPVVAHFSRTVKNQAAAEKALVVTSVPAVEGAWHWVNDQEVQWRPKAYWPSGTKVSVRASVPNVELSPGVWGKRTVTSQFQVGSAMISTVDVAAHTLTVRRDGAVIKTIPVTTGRTGYLTRDGIKVIMSRESQVRMDAATTGTDPKDPNYYNILVHWAMRLTYSGEFLHAAPWSVASQGRANVSHGCTGMSDANAKWMFDNSKVGDVVVYLHSARPLEPGNGYTAWNLSYQQWAA